MGSKKLEIVPEEVKMLVPETMKRVVVVGNDAYEVMPLTTKMASRLIEEFGKLFKEIFDGDKGWAQLAVDSHRAHEMVIKILDNGAMSAETLGSKMTASQLIHFFSCIYEQNFSRMALPEDSRKNLDRLLDFMSDLMNAKPESPEESKEKPEAEKKESQPLFSSLNSSPESMDGAENILLESGESGVHTQKDIAPELVIP